MVTWFHFDYINLCDTNVKMASNRRRSRNYEELHSSWSGRAWA